MADLIAFLRDNAEWIFGSGGVAALALALLKLTGSGKATDGADVSGGSVGGDVVGGDKTVVHRTGVGALEAGLAAALIVAAVGAVLWLAGPSNAVTADDCSAAVQGDGNTVTVTGGASCD